VTTAYLLDWLAFLGRGLHVVAGIAWIGASFYFIWLDNHLTAPADPAASDRGVGGELWAVHGGGFYHAQKYRAGPPAMPERLHWFKWEAYTTLLSGLFLLGIVYYAQAGSYMVEAGVTPLSPVGAVAVGIGFLVGGWLVYDLLCRSPLGQREGALAIVLALLCAAAAYALCKLLPGRAAFLHFGAMLGTIMVLNVRFVIIPGQRAMVDAAAAGQPVDPAHGLRGKQRSVHNTYFTLPVVFAMTSNHAAWLFGDRWNWVWLILVSLAGALIRIFFVARHKGTQTPWPLVAAGVLLAVVALALRPSHDAAESAPSAANAMQIVTERCTGCHATRPTLAGFTAPPKGLVLEQRSQVAVHAARIREQVASRAMPLGNLTHMTEAERRDLVGWLEAGCPDGR
jgi:uncharacterized membrane protein